MIEGFEILKEISQVAALLGLGGVAGFTIKQDRRITKVETLCEALITAVHELATKLDSVVVVPKQ